MKSDFMLNHVEHDTDIMSDTRDNYKEVPYHMEVSLIFLRIEPCANCI